MASHHQPRQLLAARRRPLILDGGMSRELIRLKAPFQQPEWSALALLTAPNYVREAHDAFAAAGANILTTNSYALVPFHIGEERFWQKGEELAALSGRLAAQAAKLQSDNGSTVLVAGSLPPIFGSYKPENFQEEHVQRYLEVLVCGLRPFVDVWLGETLSLIAEAEAVRTALASDSKPIWISFTLKDARDSSGSDTPRLLGGQTVEEAARWALQAGVNALLFNCSSPESMLPALRVAKAIFTEASLPEDQLPLVGVYANTFEPRPHDYEASVGIAETRRDMTPEIYLQFAREWYACGASVVGGCCGIGHEHVRKLAQKL